MLESRTVKSMYLKFFSDLRVAMETRNLTPGCQGDSLFDFGGLKGEEFSSVTMTTTALGI